MHPAIKPLTSSKHSPHAQDKNCMYSSDYFTRYAFAQTCHVSSIPKLGYLKKLLHLDALHFSKHYPFQFILHSFSRIFIKMDNNLISCFSNLLYGLCSCILFVFIFVRIVSLLLVAIKKRR